MVGPPALLIERPGGGGDGVQAAQARTGHQHARKRERAGAPPRGWVGEDWALVTEFSVPAPDRFVRQMATFIREDDGSWRRGDERHDNVLIETDRVPALLAAVGVEATVRASFGAEELPAGLRAVVGRRPA